MTASARELLEAGVHIGHQKRRWNPKAREIVYDHRHGISIIDLEKTEKMLQEACQFMEDLVASGKQILLVGTKKQSQELIREAGTETQMPFCANRWLGGYLTNFPTIKRSLEKYRGFLKMEEDNFSQVVNKKEVAAIKREMSRMNRNFEGTLNMKELPAAMFVVDVKTEIIAINEARKLNIPVIALVDTNSDPSLVNYPIPGNDDAVKAIRIIIENVMEAIQAGLTRRDASKVSATAVDSFAKEAFVKEEAAEAKTEEA